MFIPSNVDIRLLRVFRTIVECGGFTPAEVELNISASTISNHMSDLESRLGMRLCKRGRGGFALTDEGRSVYEACERLYVALESFGSDIGAVRGHLTGTLNIGAVDNIISDPNARLYNVISEFKEQAHEVHINLKITSPNEIERTVLDGRLHVGISSVYHRQSSLNYQPLYTERLALFCGHEHPLFDLAPDRLGVKDLYKIDYVTRGFVGIREKPSTNLDVSRTATAYQMEGIAILILSGKFIGYLPVHYANQWVRQGMMKRILPGQLAYDAEHNIVTKTGTEHNPVVQNFLKTLRAAYSPENNK